MKAVKQITIDDVIHNYGFPSIFTGKRYIISDGLNKKDKKVMINREYPRYYETTVYGVDTYGKPYEYSESILKVDLYTDEITIY